MNHPASFPTSHRGQTLAVPRSLTPRQRKTLRALAHHLRPCVQLGAQGLTETVEKQISEALEHHELIKVSLGKSSHTAQASDKEDLQSQLAAALDERSHVVSRVGGVVILYREVALERARLPLANLSSIQAERA